MASSPIFQNSHGIVTRIGETYVVHLQDRELRDPKHWEGIDELFNEVITHILGEREENKSHAPMPAPAVIVNYEQVENMKKEGLSNILALNLRLRPFKGSITLVAPQGSQVQEKFTELGFGSSLRNNLDDALSAVSAHQR